MGTKDTYWFPHDYEPTGDPKIQALIGDFKAEGYGIYWRIVEMLHADTQHKLPLKKYIFLAIANQMQANAEQIENLIQQSIKTYELFESDGIHFWVNRVHRNIEKKEKISKERSEAGKIGGKAKQKKAIAKQT